MAADPTSRPERFRAPIGTRDVLSPESDRRRALVARFAQVAEQAGYRNLVTPIFEELGVFQRVGEATDVVTKEMYDFADKGGRTMALRPEVTASVCRAFAEHRPAVLPWKVWYEGPQFRYEKPQKGRYRQFEQVGLEALGSDDPDLDTETIALAWRFFAGLGLRRVRVLVNSLGEAAERSRYVEALAAHLRGRSGELSEAAQATLARNPLRVLDSKRPEDAPVIADAPQLSDFLGLASVTHFERVLAGLDSLGIEAEVAPHLVRGLDYYRRTTFEFAAEALDAAQNAVGGGGRYDGLVEALGGPPTAGIGFAIGVDRTLLACDAEGVFDAPEHGPEVFVVDTTGSVLGLDLTERLRRAGLAADRAWASELSDEGLGRPRSMKAQMKAADRSGAQVAVLLGPDELEDGEVSLRPLRSPDPQAQGSGQRRVAIEALVPEVRSMLAGSAHPGAASA
ncbi:MAG: histidine--tRNA ligase [Microthrixaceae bacterium]